MQKTSRKLVLICHNLRSCHNIGSLLRTADGFAVEKIYLTGYSPYPLQAKDDRLPFVAAKIAKQIQKTALGAELSCDWEYIEDIFSVITSLRAKGFMIAGLEQAPGSFKLPDWDVPNKVALILGRETKGIEKEILATCDYAVEIPMLGKKESFNVVQAAAIALYHARFS